VPLPFLVPIAASLAAALAADAMAYRKVDDGDEGGGTAGPPRRRKPTPEEERAALVEQVEEEVIPALSSDLVALVGAIEARLPARAKDSLEDLRANFSAGIELLGEARSQRLQFFERLEGDFQEATDAVEAHLAKGKAYTSLALYEAKELQSLLEDKLLGPWRLANDIVDRKGREEAARPPGKRPALAPVEGVWTPKAETLCFECHGPKFPDSTVSPAEMARYMTPMSEGAYPESDVTMCDRCRRAIVLEHDIGRLGQIRDRLKDGLGLVNTVLVQSGGMAGHLELPWGEDDAGRDVFLRVYVDDDGEALHVVHVTVDSSEDSEEAIDIGSTALPLRATALVVTGLGFGTPKKDEVARDLLEDALSDAIAGLLSLFSGLVDRTARERAAGRSDITDGPKARFSRPGITDSDVVMDLVTWMDAHGTGSGSVAMDELVWPDEWFTELLARGLRVLGLWELVDEIDRLAVETGTDPIGVDPEKGYPRSFLFPFSDQFDAFVEWVDHWKMGRGTVNDIVAAGLKAKGIEEVEVISSGGGFEHAQFLVKDVAGTILATVTLSDLSIDYLSAMVNVGSGGKAEWREEEPSYSLAPKGPEYDVTPDEGRIHPTRIAFAVDWVDRIDAAIRSALVAGEALDASGGVVDVADVERTS
jgi:hypothetical protein